MLLTALDFGLLAATTLLPPTLAHPALEVRQNDTAHDNKTVIPFDSVPVTDISGPAGAQNFEYYFQSGISWIGKQVGATPVPLWFIEVHTFDTDEFHRSTARLQPSASASDFIKMKFYYAHQGRYTIFNWDSDSVSDLEDWSKINGRPDRLYKWFRGLQPFQATELQGVMTMARAFSLLQGAGWTDKWTRVQIGRFRESQPGHSPELFLAFERAGRKDWVYVGTTSESIFHDKEGPLDISGESSSFEPA